MPSVSSVAADVSTASRGEPRITSSSGKYRLRHRATAGNSGLLLPPWTRRKCAMRNKLTKRVVRGGAVSAIGVVMLSLGSAAAAGLSPQDRCAIAKLEAASREAACLAEAQIEGIRQGLTDQQVDRRKAACGQREQQSYKN